MPDLGRTTSDLYGQYCHQYIVDRLKAVGLDAVYTRAKGDRVWWQQGEQPVEVLDMAGGYGAALFGHNHPALVAELKGLLDQEVPVLTQGSCRAGAALLAERLNQLVEGDYVTIFTNSGTETVEAAIKHAILERQGPEKPVFLAVENAFHGKTFGAIQLTPNYSEPFDKWGPEVRFLDPMDPADWQKAQEETAGRVVAVFIEPIQGEGGIRPLPSAFLKWLSETCRAQNIPLVADEIQTGMGRTGTFLASEQFGVQPDYICLSKALGGGLVKIGALLIKQSRFIPEFALKHTSTFAEDDLSCLVALKALQILEEEQLPDRCAESGQYLLTELEKVRSEFRGQIREVRGMGLMIGIEFMDQTDSPSNILKMISDQGMLGWLVAGYLFTKHGIRIAPTLSDPFTLRAEPSAYISRTDMGRFVNAVRTVVQALELADAGHLTGFPFGLTRGPEQKIFALPTREQPITPTTPKVGFLGHWISPKHAVHFDPSLKGIPTNKLQAYLEKSSLVLEPSIYDRINVRSQTGDVVHLSFIGLNLTPDQIIQMMRSSDLRWVHEQIAAAVDLAKDLGCSVVGLGGYLSSVTPDCLLVQTEGITLTSGNSLTVGMGIETLKEAAHSAHIALAQAHMAVVGAPGSIAGTVALLMAPHVKQITLISRPTDSSSLARLNDLVAHIHAASPETAIKVSDTLDALRSCSLIATASTSGGGIIQPEHLADEPLVICDISLPRDVSLSVMRSCPKARIISAGIVRLPYNDDFSISGIPLPRGHALACMIETLLMGFEGRTTPYPVSSQGVKDALAMAQRHGFTLADRWRRRSF